MIAGQLAGRLIFFLDFLLQNVEFFLSQIAYVVKIFIGLLDLSFLNLTE